MNECNICPKDIKAKCIEHHDEKTIHEICGTHYCRWSWKGQKEFGKTTHNKDYTVTQSGIASPKVTS